MSRAGRTVASVVGLVALVVGVPALLIAIVGWPLPRGLPSPDEVGRALGDGWRPGGRFVLGVLGLVAWVLWVQLVRHVVSEARRQHRSGPRPAVSTSTGGWSARLAAWLVGGLVLAGPVTAAAATAAPAIPVVLSVTRALEPPTISVPAPPPPAAEPAPVPLPSYVVHTWDERRDCLWNIAKRYLGDPFRWSELLALNAGVLQPDGRRLADDAQHWVYPGMQLRLPADATGPEVVTATTPPPVPAADVGAVNGSARPWVADVPRPDAALPTASAGGGRREQARAADRPPPRAAADHNGQRDRTTGGRDVSSDRGVATLGRGAMLVAQALALGLPVFAAGGLVRRLNRRRRAQLAWRRPGHDIGRPDPAAEALELKARAIAADEAAEWVDATLRVLGVRLREAAMAAPAITCVRAGALGLEILLAQPSAKAPRGFTAVDDGFVWRLDAHAELGQLQGEADKHTVVASALVSVGASPEGPLLVDLEALGILSVEGAPERVRAFLAGAALELASAPWAQGVDVRLVGPEPGLGGVDGVEVVDDVGSLVDELAGLSRATAAALGEGRTTLAGRLAEPAEAWFPTVVVVGGSESPEAMARLAEATAAGSGVALVGPGPFAGATWRLVVVDDGRARLEPLGLVVRAAGAPQALEVDIGALDDHDIATASGLLAAASSDDVARPADVAADASDHRESRVIRRRYEVWVKVLGPVEVSGWARPAGLRRKYEEILAYLATHEGRVGGERFRFALWPDKELDPKSFREAMSRVRGHLGRDTGHLPPAVAGAYFLGDEVGSDWTLFKQLSAAAGSAARSDPTEAIALWREALELVRGEPFGGGLHDAGAYGWAYSEMLVYEMQRQITDAAHHLAELALAADDPETTLWATKQGHLATPGQLSLFEWQMRVARHRLDADGLKLAYRSRRLAEQTLDPTADVAPETTQLYQRLLAEISATAQRRAHTPAD